MPAPQRVKRAFGSYGRLPDKAYRARNDSGDGSMSGKLKGEFMGLDRRAVILTLPQAGGPDVRLPPIDASTLDKLIAELARFRSQMTTSPQKDVPPIARGQIEPVQFDISLDAATGLPVLQIVRSGKVTRLVLDHETALGMGEALARMAEESARSQGRSN
jgi:hypothetical protein